MLAESMCTCAHPLIFELLLSLGDVLLVAVDLTLQRLDVGCLVVKVTARLPQLALKLVFLARLALRLVRLDLNVLLQLYGGAKQRQVNSWKLGLNACVLIDHNTLTCMYMYMFPLQK